MQLPQVVAALLGGLVVLSTIVPSADAAAGDSFLGDLVTASASPVNGGTYKDTNGGYGTVSIIDNDGVTFSWEVDIFQAPLPTTIELVLSVPGLPSLMLLTDQPSSDGISFGSLEAATLAAAIAASANPAANLRDGSISVVAKFAKPAGSALMAQISDGTTITYAVNTPPSPPATTPPAPDMYAMHPGVTPEIFFSQLDGSQVSILESGLLNPGNGTASILIYDWLDGTYTWELEINNVASPQSMELRVFVDLVNQPLVFNVTPHQPWAPDTLSYTGSFTAEQLRAGLEAAGQPDASLNDHTPNLFLEIIDAGGITQEELVAAAAPAPAGTPIGTVADLRRRQLLQAAGTAPAPSLEAFAPAPSPLGSFDAGAGSPPTAGSCSTQEQPSRIVGFIFDSKSRYKLKPVLKDTNSLPKSVEEIPVFISAGILGIFLIAFVSMYVSGTLEAAAA